MAILTFVGETALFLLREWRRDPRLRQQLTKRTCLVDSTPDNFKRWTKNRLSELDMRIAAYLKTGKKLDVAVSNRNTRLQARVVNTKTYSKISNIPAFIPLNENMLIASPELIFYELCPKLSLGQRILLGHELCGRFSRDSFDPLKGPAIPDVPAMTSTKSIDTYKSKIPYLRRTNTVTAALPYIKDNAWSPSESLFATLAVLPIEEGGYELPPYSFNVEVKTPRNLMLSTNKTKRIPDLVFDNTPVGINYDGAMHLDLDSIASAAIKLGNDPGDSTAYHQLEQAIRKVREKFVDDIRRNRELTAGGMFIYPIVKEDLYDVDATDRVMMQIIETIEAHSNLCLAKQKRALLNPLSKRQRIRLANDLLHSEKPLTPINSLLPSTTLVTIGF